MWLCEKSNMTNCLFTLIQVIQISRSKYLVEMFLLFNKKNMQSSSFGENNIHFMCRCVSLKFDAWQLKRFVLLLLVHFNFISDLRSKIVVGTFIFLSNVQSLFSFRGDFRHARIFRSFTGFPAGWLIYMLDLMRF